VRWPFFSRKTDFSPLRLPLPDALHVALSVYLSFGSEPQPRPEALLEPTREWIRGQRGEMLPKALMELSKREILAFRGRTTVDAAGAAAGDRPLHGSR
jgi:hypothetical protein